MPPASARRRVRLETAERPGQMGSIQRGRLRRVSSINRRVRLRHRRRRNRGPFSVCRVMHAKRCFVSTLSWAPSRNRFRFEGGMGSRGKRLWRWCRCRRQDRCGQLSSTIRIRGGHGAIEIVGRNRIILWLCFCHDASPRFSVLSRPADRQWEGLRPRTRKDF
jgi:hypothetical protein